MDGLIAGGMRAEEAAAPYRVAPLLTDHLDTFASAPEGFKRLRELVLNLAVRGRLVQQDPDDEPAEKLFERIGQETRLLRTTSTKRHATSKQSDRDDPYELPSSWLWTQLEDVFYSISPSSNKLLTSRIQEAGTYPVVDQGKRFIAGYTDSVELLIRLPGPVIVFGDHTTERKFIDFDFVAGADGVKILRPICLSEKYFYWFVVSQEIADRGYARHYRVLVDRRFPLPPLAEQSRIVAKVEELMALIDRLEAKAGANEAARGKLLGALLVALADSPDAAATADAWVQLAPHFDLLLQTPADVDRLQQTLLTLAVKGRLVPQDPNDEPAAELLKRIRAEKDRLVAEGKIKRDKLLPAVGDDEIPYPLPQGWIWVRVPDVAETRLGKMLDKAKNRGHLKPYLRNTNVQWFRFDLSDIKELRLEDDSLAEFRVLPGDLLICEGGEPGRCAIWRDSEREIYFQKALHRVRTYCAVLPEFVQLCLRVDCANGWLERFFTGATIKHLTGQQLESYCVPLPPLAEQSRIVAAVASLTAFCDRLRDRLAARRDLSAKLATALADNALGKSNEV